MFEITICFNLFLTLLMENLNDRKTHNYLIVCDLRTGMQFALLSAWIPEPPTNIDFHANHPFYMAILSRTDDVLFLGRLSKP